MLETLETLRQQTVEAWVNKEIHNKTNYGERAKNDGEGRPFLSSRLRPVRPVLSRPFVSVLTCSCLALARTHPNSNWLGS